MQERTVDVAIIGSGTAGLNAVGQVRKTGKSFVLINGGEVGTTCARVGCMPSKAMIQIAEDYHRRTTFPRHGIEGSDALELTTTDAMEHVRDLRDSFVERVTSNSTDKMGDKFIEGFAEFLDANTLKVNDEIIHATKIIVATGSRPIVPAEWEQFRDRIITSDEIFELEALPGSMAVIGLGVIGLELGQALHRYGVEVTGIDIRNSIGGLTDPDLVKAAVEIFSKEFPIWLGQPARISREEDMLRVTAGDNSVLVDYLLLSMGRTPNLEKLGLEKLNLPVGDNVVPVHNSHTMQVADLPIFLAGDATGERPILHEAGDEGRIAGYNAAREEITAFARKTHLAITFCDPNIAMVGKTWDLLDHDQVAVGEMRFAPVGRALIMAKNKGLLRVYANKSDGTLLGAEMACVKGENLAHLLAWSIQQGRTVFDLLKMPFYHPVIEEALQAALNDLAGKIEQQPQGLLELDLL
ncbi:MAG: dihydrolipoyl dehydrogenase [Chromatiales bacterium]|nr:dihydrolipoyl dehydrogenase [Chromatiales bacterium]